MKNTFGQYVRERREALKANDKGYSLRKVAERIGVEPSYLRLLAVNLSKL